jgi:hypothetical protein
MKGVDARTHLALRTRRQKMTTTWVALALETAVGMAIAGTATAWLRARIAAERKAAIVIEEPATDH